MKLLPHNEETYKEVLEKFKTHNTVALTQATGTGKSFIASKIAKEEYKGKNICVLAAETANLYNYKTNLQLDDDKVKFLTYSGLMRLSRESVENLAKTTAFFIFDEYHRAGAVEWGVNVGILLSLIEKYNKKVLGITATEIRYLDNRRNMSNELFDGVKVVGVDIIEGIARGVLPEIIYVTAMYSIEDEIKEIKRRVKEDKRKKRTQKENKELIEQLESINLKFKDEFSIKNIIKNELNEAPKEQKWIVFCKDLRELEKIDNLLYDWFGKEINIYSVTCRDSGVETEKIMREFNEITKGVNIIKCVDKLNEGVHIKGLTGIIMLRKTESPNLFIQQLGRALESGVDSKPIIFDFINNYKELKSYLKTPIDILETLSEKVIDKQNSEKIIDGYGSPIIIKNYVKDFEEVMKKVNKALDLEEWQEWEDAILVVNYPINGVKCFSFLDHRTPSACKARVQFLGLTRKLLKWDDNDLRILRKYGGIEGKNVSKRFADKSSVQCINELKKRGWFIKKSFSSGDIKRLELGILEYGLYDAYKVFKDDKPYPTNQISCLLRAEKLGYKVDWNMIDEEERRYAGIIQ